MSTLEFQHKVDQLAPVLNSFAYNLTKNSEDAKDLFQETAFRAFKNMDKYRPGTNLKAWMFTIMKNIFINNYRKKLKANTIQDSTDNMYYLNSGSVSITNGADSNIMVKEIHKMVDGLDDTLRIPFVMHFEGYKYQEIAETLDLPLGTVKSRIFFARKELKHLIHARYNKIFSHREKAS
jgi:RNA polymerase sigma-70 factor (ECF subfamily)